MRSIAASSESVSAHATVRGTVLPIGRLAAVFGPAPERRPDNVTFYGLLSTADLKCDYTGDSLRLSLDAVIVSQRGPAAKGDAVDLQFFIAVAGPDRSILSKRPFAVHIVFEGTQTRAGVTDHIEETIPLDGRKGPGLNVLLGFQQSDEVVEFYKHWRSRSPA
jgi:hypothetical protein